MFPFPETPDTVENLHYVSKKLKKKEIKFILMQHTNNEKKTKILTLLEMFPFPETPYAAENLHDVSKKFNLKSSWLKCKMSNSNSQVSSHCRVCGSL